MAFFFDYGNYDYQNYPYGDDQFCDCRFCHDAYMQAIGGYEPIFHEPVFDYYEEVYEDYEQHFNIFPPLCDIDLPHFGDPLAPFDDSDLYLEFLLGYPENVERGRRFWADDEPTSDNDDGESMYNEYESSFDGCESTDYEESSESYVDDYESSFDEYESTSNDGEASYVCDSTYGIYKSTSKKYEATNNNYEPTFPSIFKREYYVPRSNDGATHSNSKLIAEIPLEIETNNKGKESRTETEPKSKEKYEKFDTQSRKKPERCALCNKII